MLHGLATSSPYVTIVPTLSDNYAYILKNPESNSSLCIDPAEADKVVHLANQNKLILEACLCTHKHYDHSGGNEKIKKLVPGIKVYGSSYEPIPGLTNKVSDNDTYEIAGFNVKCIRAECHTIGHIMYYVTHKNFKEPIIFTGDTIFIAGCGRFFEGNAKKMLEITNNFKRLPPETLVYCGHEYTVKNLKFTNELENGSNPNVLHALDIAMKLRCEDKPTVPSTIAQVLYYLYYIQLTNASHDKFLYIQNFIIEGSTFI